MFHSGEKIISGEAKSGVKREVLVTRRESVQRERESKITKRSFLHHSYQEGGEWGKNSIM